jgi:hypothetical protein
MRLPENAHLSRYPHPSSLRRTSMYASFLGISEALHMDIFHQPLRSRFFDSLNDWEKFSKPILASYNGTHKFLARFERNWGMGIAGFSGC